MLLLLTSSGCAAHKRTALPVKSNVRVTFRNIQYDDNGFAHCVINDVRLDAKDGHYIAVCKEDPEEK